MKKIKLVGVTFVCFFVIIFLLYNWELKGK